MENIALPRPWTFALAALQLAGLWVRRSRTRRALRRLDARLLDDIGLGEAARAAECAKRFWEP